MTEQDRSVNIEQKYLKKGGMVALVTILGMTAPLSTDMYMPSLPSMAEYFGVSAVIANFTLVAFFFFMAVGMLIFGPLSDKYGRKKILIISLAFYGAGSFLCAVSANVYVMIADRAVQALGGGGMVSLSVAIIKDSFSGKLRATALAAVQSMAVIAPVMSPVIGALILKVATWRMVFVVLTCIALCAIIAALLFQESIHPDEINEGGITDSLKRIVKVAGNINFTPFLVTGSIFSGSFMAYIATASYTYQEFFGLSPSRFSFFFAINACFSALGPLLFMRLGGVISAKKIMFALYLVGIAVSLALIFVGDMSPVVFLCCFIPFAIANSFNRPFTTSILLEQQKGDTGSASALLNFVYTLFGSLGLFIGSMDWSNYIFGLGITIGSFTLVSAALWILILRSSKIHMRGIHRKLY